MSWNYLFPSVSGTPDGAMATNAQQIRNTLTKDTIKNKLVFEVRVLTPCVKTHMSTMAIPLPPEEEAEKKASMAKEGIDTNVTLTPPPLTDDTYSFFGRIEDDPDLPFISPHAQISDPCNISLTAKPTYALELIKLHTQFISKSGYTLNGPEPVVGDRVQVILDKGDISYNLQYCYFEEISNTSDKEILNENDEADCASLEMIFANFDEDTDLSTYVQNITPVDAAALASQSLERNARIQRFFAAAQPFLPKDTTLNSSGRSIGYGHNMIVRMARKEGIEVKPGAAPYSDVSTWDPTYVEKLRGILTDKTGPYKKDIADPAKSNHCIGPGCKNSGRIAIDMSASDLSALSAGLLKFKNSTAPNGLNAMIDSGILKEIFAPGSAGSWIGTNGWKLEPYNTAVHVEIKIIEGAPVAAAEAAADPYGGRPDPTAAGGHSFDELVGNVVLEEVAWESRAGETRSEYAAVRQGTTWSTKELIDDWGWSVKFADGTTATTYDDLKKLSATKFDYTYIPPSPESDPAAE